MLGSLLDIVLPPLCPLCGVKSTREFCTDCSKGITPIQEPLCITCGIPFNDKTPEERPCGDCLKKKRSFDSARSALIYSDAARDSIRRLKFYSVFSLVPPLSGLLEETLIKQLDNLQGTVVVPVPLHKARLRERGFNQSLLLARALANRLKLDLDYRALKRTRATRPQTELSGSEREENVKGAFTIIDPKNIKDKKILLIDDVYTTGATVNECAHVLKKHSDKVHVLTLARAIRL